MKTQIQKTAFIFLSLLMMAIAGNAQDSLSENYHPYYRNVIKFETFSPLFGHTTVGYARFIKPNVSLETKVGFIGVSLNVPDDPRNGFFVKFGPTFYSASKNEREVGAGLNFIEGLYLRPELSYTNYSWDKEGSTIYDWNTNLYVTEPDARITETYFTLMVNTGVEANLSKRFQLDFFAGLGYELGYKTGGTDAGRNMRGGYRYSHVGGGGEFPIAFTSGLTLGYRF